MAGCLFAFLICLELFEVLRMLSEIDPRLTIAAISLLVLAFAFYYVYRRRRNRRFFLTAQGYRSGGNSTHAEMKRYGRFLVYYCKRLTTHRLLTEQQSGVISQRAHDISEAIHHHPLNDDLQRAIAQARNDIIRPTFHYLDSISQKITESKARAVIQDLYQPPFPVIAPLVVFYHQFTLVSEITDTYISRPSLREYLRVMSDVWAVMTKGDFLRYGQRLFSGINSNPYSLGRAGEDLGQAFSVTWLTHAVARAATLRCCTLHDWKLRDAISDMRSNITPCLARTRDTLVQDAMPILKERIRHYTPVSYDPASFVQEISTSFVKSVDAVVMTLSTAERQNSAHQTSPGLVTGTGAAPIPVDEKPRDKVHPMEANAPHRRYHRRRRHRSSSRIGRFFQRIIYMGHRPRN